MFMQRFLSTWEETSASTYVLYEHLGRSELQTDCDASSDMPIESAPLQDPPESLRKELESKGVEHEAFVMDDLCPSGNLTRAEKLKALRAALKRANARCYAFVSFYTYQEAK